MNLKLAQALKLRATHENTLVMRRSLSADKDQGAEVPTIVRDRRRRARRVPDRLEVCQLREAVGQASPVAAIIENMPKSPTGAFFVHWFLQQRGLTTTRGRKPGDAAGGISWLNEIECARTATWACQTAREIITAVLTMLPQDFRLTAINHFRDRIRQM